GGRLGIRQLGSSKRRQLPASLESVAPRTAPGQLRLPLSSKTAFAWTAGPSVSSSCSDPWQTRSRGCRRRGSVGSIDSFAQESRCQPQAGTGLENQGCCGPWPPGTNKSIEHRHQPPSIRGPQALTSTKSSIAAGSCLDIRRPGCDRTGHRFQRQDCHPPSFPPSTATSRRNENILALLGCRI